MTSRHRSLPGTSSTVFERMQKRVNQLPNNFKDHAEHWTRIGREVTKPRSYSVYDKIVEQHLSQCTGRTSEGMSSVSSRPLIKKISEDAVTDTMDHQPFRRSTIQSTYDIFERYTEFGGLIEGHKESLTAPMEDRESDASMASPPKEKHKIPGLTAKSTLHLYKQMVRPTDHMKKAKFPERQLFIYVVADPTDMRLEMIALRGLVWPALQRMCTQRGFTLHIIDQHMGTDLDPSSTPEFEIQRRTKIFNDHMRRRQDQQSFVNCLFLLSTRSVGPVPRLPTSLRRSTVNYVIQAAQKEMNELEAEVRKLTDELHSTELTPTSGTEDIIISSPPSGRDGGEEDPNSDNQLTHVPLRRPAAIEDSTVQTLELIRTLKPDCIEKWYRSEEIAPENDVCQFQPLGRVIPDVLCFDDPSQRQLAIEGFLNEAHRIRCLLLRYLKWPDDINTNSATSSKDQHSYKNTGAAEFGRKPEASNYLSAPEVLHGDLDFLLQSAVEEETRTILGASCDNTDCLVVIRHHDDEELGGEPIGTNEQFPHVDPTISSNSQRGLFSVHPNTTHLMEPFVQSAIRARHLVEYARLMVPPENQIYYDVIAPDTLTLEDKITCRRFPLDPFSDKEHARYLEQLCRNIHTLFEGTLEREMNRRLGKTPDQQLSKLEACDNDDGELLWSPEFEISAHLERCESLSKEFIAHQDILDEVISWMNSNIHSPSEMGGEFALLTVMGQSGSGKSVFLAKLAQLLLEGNCLKEK
ncbi:unnamed protein product [Dicrocoelium dendriticum]|nr:unnamed protein product [Dicrocoelium dendriticum]